MKITDVRPVLVRAARYTNWVFVELETDAGIVGTGEAALSGDEAQLETLLGRLRSELVPTDLRSLDVADLGCDGDFDAIALATVRSAIDQAKWDVRSKVAGEPLWRLLGERGGRTVPLYANINRAAHDRSADAMAAIAVRARDEGFVAVKCAPFDGLTRADGDGAVGRTALAEGIARVGAIRDAIGSDVGLMIDCHWRLTPACAAVLVDELAGLGVTWLEDPFPESCTDEWVALQRQTTIPLAGGERATSLAELARALSARQYQICCPDVRTIGGVGPLWHASKLIASFGVAFAPHNPRGPIGTLASAHVAAGARELLYLEFPYGECDWRAEFVSGGERVENGRLVLPTSPGLGGHIDHAVAQSHPYERVAPPRETTEADIW